MYPFSTFTLSQRRVEEILSVNVYSMCSTQTGLDYHNKNAYWCTPTGFSLQKWGCFFSEFAGEAQVTLAPIFRTSQTNSLPFPRLLPLLTTANNDCSHQRWITNINSKDMERDWFKKSFDRANTQQIHKKWLNTRQTHTHTCTHRTQHYQPKLFSFWKEKVCIMYIIQICILLVLQHVSQ